MIHVRDKHKLL